MSAIALHRLRALRRSGYACQHRDVLGTACLMPASLVVHDEPRCRDHADDC